MIQKEMFNILRAELNNSLNNLTLTDKKPSLLVVGKVGLYKKQLVTNIFGELSDIDITQEENIRIYKYTNITVFIYDIEQNSNYKEFINSFQEEIDLIWYCSSAQSLLNKQWDFEVIRVLQEYSPTALIVTNIKMFLRSHYIKKLRDLIDQQCTCSVFPTYLNVNVPLNNNNNNNESWQELLVWSISVIHGNYQEDVVSSFYSPDGLEEKKKFVARKLIPSYTGGATAIGAIPIPFSDAILLIPEQVAMTIHILKLYDLENSSRIVSKIVGTTIISQLGRMITASLIKIVPTIGSVTGSAINATVAGSLTWILGMAVSELAYRYKKALHRGEDVSFDDFFNSEGIREAINHFSNKEEDM